MCTAGLGQEARADRIALDVVQVEAKGVDDPGSPPRMTGLKPYEEALTKLPVATLEKVGSSAQRLERDEAKAIELPKTSHKLRADLTYTGEPGSGWVSVTVEISRPAKQGEDGEKKRRRVMRSRLRIKRGGVALLFLKEARGEGRHLVLLLHPRVSG